MGSRVSTATDCHPTFRMRALFVVFLATAAQCQQSQDDYAHDPSGDQGEPYVHDPTGDLTPFQLYKLRKGLASPNDLQQAAPAPQRAPVASRPAAVQPAFQQQNFQQAQPSRTFSRLKQLDQLPQPSVNLLLHRLSQLGPKHQHSDNQLLSLKLLDQLLHLPQPSVSLHLYNRPKHKLQHSSKHKLPHRLLEAPSPMKSLFEMTSFKENKFIYISSYL